MKCPICNRIKIIERYEISTDCDLDDHVLITITGNAYCPYCNRHFNMCGSKSVISEYPILLDETKSEVLLDRKIRMLVDMLEHIDKKEETL